ncbi:MAG: DUF1638 domain-containing protein [Methanomassiliicoccus sp.]|nr:DUF1638 domain-containing protein [Methanomassiliicoccus sp.]
MPGQEEIMRIGIIACETFERGLEELIQGDEDIVYKEYLEFGLHEYPEDLKRVVIDKVNSLEGKVDAVLLGYGICNSLKDVVAEMRVPTVQLVGDDCIGVLITPEEYARERKICAGTMYHTPYFSKMGREWFERKLSEQMPNYREVGLDLDWYLRTMFDGYQRVLFIDDGLGNMEEFETMSRRFAADLHLRYERRCGTLELLAQGLARTKELARGRA